MQKHTKNKRPTLGFTEGEIKIALILLEKLEKTIELLYYLMKNKNERPFVLMLISAEGQYDIGSLVQKEKRDTDLYYSIENNENLHAVICQETKVDGGYHFAQRLLKHMLIDDAKEVYCVELEVRSTRFDIKEIIFKLIENYVKAKEEKRDSEIIYHSL